MGLITNAVIIGVVLAVALPFVLHYFIGGGSKKNNIIYVITQTFEGASKTYLLNGRIEKWNSDMIGEFKVVKGNQEMSIGSFHQKWLQPTNKDKFILFLEEFDVNRYRPMKPANKPHSEQVPELDQQGNVQRDEYGNIKYESKQATDIEYVPNNDINWMITTTDRVKQFTENKKQKDPMKQYLIAGGLLFFVLIGIFVNAYFQHQTGMQLSKSADKMANAIESQSPKAEAEAYMDLISKTLKNETMRQIVQPKPDKTSQAPPGAE